MDATSDGCTAGRALWALGNVEIKLEPKEPEGEVFVAGAELAPLITFQ